MPTRSDFAIDFIPTLKPRTGVSLEQQIARGIRAAVLDGQLFDGMRLPSSRALAKALGVNRNTVTGALESLVIEGYLQARQGSGTFVAPRVQVSHRAAVVRSARWLNAIPNPQVAAAPLPLDFRVCQPSTQDFPLQAWRRAWREAVRHAPSADYEEPAGHQGFRQAIALYLQRARGMTCSPEQVLVTSGAIQAINLIAQAALPPQATVAFEDPGYPLARQVFERQGARILSVAVDEDGLRTDTLPVGAAAPHLIYVTPSHQFPLGYRLSLPRRLALLAWARQNDVLVVEDDYDSEFRFGAAPLPPLASLDTTGHVAYVGTFSKVLSPALRVGYVVATPAFHDRLVRIKTSVDYHTSGIAQLALERCIVSGMLERHISQMRRVYAEKRSALTDAFDPVSKIARVNGLEAGLNLFLECDPALNLSRIQRRCAESGVGVHLVSLYGVGPDQPHGLILGYGGLELSQIAAASRCLVAALSNNGR